ncbi:MAG: TMEM165/GDT1 family protein [Phormidesmis sp.]
MPSSDSTPSDTPSVISEEVIVAGETPRKRTSETSDKSADLSSNSASVVGSGFWPVFISTFATIFLAELGDKTQVTTMLMSAESQAPLVVFLGAGLALISTSLIGVLLGQWLSTRVSEETLDTCAGILLILITIGLVGDIMSS